MIPLAHKNGGPRRAAEAHEGGEGGDDHDKRHADAHAGQRHRAHIRNVADINAVHDVVQHVDDLRRYGGQGQLEQQPADRLFPQKILVLVHGVSLLVMAFCAFSIIRRFTLSNRTLSSSVSPAKIVSSYCLQMTSMEATIGPAVGVRNR